MKVLSILPRNVPGVNPPQPMESFLVEFGEKRERKYEFKLDVKTGEHTCDVTDPEDLAALLAIKEGYRIHPSEEGALKKQRAAEKAAADKALAEVAAYNAKLDKMKRKELDAEMKARGLESADGEDATDDDLRGLLRKDVPPEAK